MSGARLRDLLVVGGSVAGWMTAAILARSLPRRLYSIRVVEPATSAPDLETIGAIATLPLVRGAHEALGLNDAALVRHAAASFSLGAEFFGWPRKGRQYFRPFAAFGAPLDGIAFHHLWQRMRRAGGAGELEEYSLAATAARLGRFALPESDPGSVLSTLDYGYHLDGALMRGCCAQSPSRPARSGSRATSSAPNCAATMARSPPSRLPTAAGSRRISSSTARARARP
jgi:tryptophan halogenase